MLLEGRTDLVCVPGGARGTAGSPAAPGVLLEGRGRSPAAEGELVDQLACARSAAILPREARARRTATSNSRRRRRRRRRRRPPPGEGGRLAAGRASARSRAEPKTSVENVKVTIEGMKSLQATLAFDMEHGETRPIDLLHAQGQKRRRRPGGRRTQRASDPRRRSHPGRRRQPEYEIRQDHHRPASRGTHEHQQGEVNYTYQLEGTDIMKIVLRNKVLSIPFVVVCLTLAIR
ncbi:MAG: hypothetical protein MZV70_05615, partial [Desulfobacterales bacterium]|nr:hypothetical protein [Desulfobacterales bacterium]